MRMAVIKVIYCRSRVIRGDYAAAGRDSHPREPRRRGRSIPGPVRSRARLRRAGRDRRAMPVGLHAGADDGAGGAHLRDAPRGARISRRPLDRWTRPDLCRAGSLARRAGKLPGAGTGLDQPPRRIDVADVAPARARTRGDLSSECSGCRFRRVEGAIGVPTSSSENGGHAFALPTLRSLPDLILRSRASGVSKDEWHQPGLMVRDAAARLLTMRVQWAICELTCPSGSSPSRVCRTCRRTCRTRWRRRSCRTASAPCRLRPAR